MSKAKTQAVTADTNTAAPDAKAESKAKTVKVRVLLDCQYGKCNSIAQLAADVAKQAEKDGFVDTGADAVAAVEGAE